MSFMRLLLPLLLLFAGGCAIKPPPLTPANRMCAFVSYDLRVARPPDLRDAASDRRTLGDVLDETVFRGGLADATAPSESMLFLSGGSLNGAFGAGFLDQWKRLTTQQHLPDFKVVTGISTGSILATFAFLDQPERAVEGYTIDKESDLLTVPPGGVKNGDPTIAAYVQLLNKGALSDLGPLRGRLRGFFDDATLRKVAAEGARGRKLLIGVVDVDTGQAVVLDLTEMAAQYVAASDDLTRQLKRDCYVEGVLASSSAPLAAVPVFIDNRMYIDGGARFGMFSDEIGDRIERLADSSAKPTIYLLINGDQEIDPRCGKAEDTNCNRPGGLSAGNTTGGHASWTFTDLALRSEKILTNQVYRFSASSIKASAEQRHMGFHAIQIEQDMPGHLFDGKACKDWRVQDRQDGDPLQFYPKYMRCLIDYGRFHAGTVVPTWTAPDDGGAFGP